MVRTASVMLPLGTEAPDFRLPDYDGRIVSRNDFRGKRGLLVIFMCNHCPYVKHVASELARIADEYQARDMGVVGISSNDIESHPDDAPEMMKKEAAAQGYTFPYLYDESQSVARSYRAACTPDFFLFDSEFKLVYRGQMDETRPKQGNVPTGKDLRAALDALLAGKPQPQPQRPSIGCNIKWKAGQEPEYFNSAGVS
jgi:peroxiredoxin